ncbi:MAG: hypothetical protein ACREJ3_07385, partial [Polyangiaceae bacterium]
MVTCWPIAALMVLACALPACGLIGGVGGYVQGDGADASLDRTRDSSSMLQPDGRGDDGPASGAGDGDDATMSNELTDAGGDGASGTDGDLGDGSPTADAGTDAALEAGLNADAGTSDAGRSDSGCGLTNTVESCGVCGRACNSTTGTPSCNGASCSYTCNTGRADCNSEAGPDTDGCECSGNGCCRTGCQTSHDNGVGKSYFDCSGTDTHSQTEAQLACQAYTGSPCTPSQSGPCNCFILLCGPSAKSYCGTVGSSCYCWQYSGPSAGTLQ